MHQPHLTRYRGFTFLTLGLAGLAFLGTSVQADLGFLGVAAGDPTSTNAVLWTRAVDTTLPTVAPLVAQVAPNDPTLSSGVVSYAVSTVAAKDYTAKVVATGLQPNTRYYYRFVNNADTANASIVGTFKTAPDANTAMPVKFAFSGDMDGLMRPYALAATLSAQGLDFYVNLGDVIYENASNVAGNNGASHLNSPSVTLSGSSASLNGVPVGGTTFATQAQLKADYEKKYRENFLPVNTGGQNSLQSLYAAQGNFTTWDNHELGNRQYINGGAPAGGSVGGASGTDMPTGRGVDARDNGTGNPLNVNDVNTSLTDFMNRSIGFQTLQQVFLSYQPIADRAVSSAADPRTDGTKQLYVAQKWGKNVIYINTDTRSYRDLRLKTTNGSADDSGIRAANSARTMLGATQLAWLKQTLLDAQTAGVPWKFVSVSDPIDQLGPIGGALTGTLTGVNADGGKSWMGGYRAERNDLLKFIADNRILNVVFLATDDHQNRVNELLYSPTGQTEVQSTYVPVPHCLSIVDGPLGATGPETITDHTFTNVKAIADSLAAAQSAAGLDPVGLDSAYPGLFDVRREGDTSADTLRQPIDFYSPDTFNYNTLEVSADGKVLTIKTVGINSTPQNSASEYSATANPVREILRFSINAFAPSAFTSIPSDVTVGNDEGQCSALLNFNVSASGFPAPTITSTFNGLIISSPFNFPSGVNVVTCTAVNSEGKADGTFTVTVTDTEAPVIRSITPSRTVLLPSNHKMVPVTFTVSATDNCGIASTKIVSVTSNEPVKTKEDDDASPDWQITGDLSLQLRAERSSKGTGRVYTITVEVSDQTGNKSKKSTTVTVPHNKGEKDDNDKKEDKNDDRHDRDNRD